MQTPALNEVNVSFGPADGGSVTPPLNAVDVTWHENIAAEYLAAGFKSGSVGRPTKVPDALPIQVRVTGFRSGGVGEAEASYQITGAGISVRQRTWIKGGGFGVPSALAAGSDAASSIGFTSTIFGQHGLVVAVLPQGLQSGGIGRQSLATWFAAQPISSTQAFGQPARTGVARSIPIGRTTRFGQPTIVREGHC